MKLQHFEDSQAWKDAIKLAKLIYTTTSTFPKEEQFGITNQIRRASTSVSANIAEGFGRANAKEKIQFYSIAYGSLLETKSFIHLSTELGLCGKQSDIIELVESLQRQLNAIKRAIRG